MRRREFIELFGGALMAWPLPAQAQQPAMPVIGFLNPNSAETFAGPLAAFKQGLQEAGFVEGRNVAIAYRWADHHSERVPDLAADLVRRRVAVIVASGGGYTALAAKSATATIPIVFNSGNDPVALGLVASLGRPGGNLTGVSRLSVELMPKRLELLREVVPSATAIGVLLNLQQAEFATRAQRVQETARLLGRKAEILKVGSDRDIEAAFDAVAQLRAGALLIDSDSFFNSRSEMLGALALRYAVPAIYQSREFVAAGGLMSYGATLADAYRLMGLYTGRILNGEKPADLPVQQQTKIDFIVNLKTARTLGLTISLPLLGRADEVIE